jgi:hypothetical protein
METTSKDNCITSVSGRNAVHTGGPKLNVIDLETALGVRRILLFFVIEQLLIVHRATFNLVSKGTWSRSIVYEEVRAMSLHRLFTDVTSF